MVDDIESYVVSTAAAATTTEPRHDVVRARTNPTVCAQGVESYHTPPHSEPVTEAELPKPRTLTGVNRDAAS
jgi:hypothetical protein